MFGQMSEHYYLANGTELTVKQIERLPERTIVWWWIEGKGFMSQQRRGNWLGFLLYPTGRTVKL